MGKAILTPIDNPEKVVKASNCMMSDGVTSVESAITTINNTISGKIVKRANADLTTTNDGYSVVNKSTYKHIVSVCPITRAAISFVYQANAGQWVIYFKDAGTFAPIGSAQINADIFYTD